MKKLFFILMLTSGISIVANAQADTTKVKKTSTIPQKVHNTFNKDKKYKGYKAKQKHNGRTKKHKVDVKDGEEKTKTSK